MRKKFKIKKGKIRKMYNRHYQNSTRNNEISTPRTRRKRNYSSENSNFSNSSEDYSNSSSNFQNSPSKLKQSQQSFSSINFQIVEQLLSFVEQGLENKISKIEKLSKKNKQNIKKCKKEVKKTEQRISKLTIMDEGKDLTDKIKLYFKLVKCQSGPGKNFKKKKVEREVKNLTAREKNIKKEENFNKKFYVGNDLQALKSCSFVVKGDERAKTEEDDFLRKSDNFHKKTDKKYGKKGNYQERRSEPKIWERLYGLATSQSKEKRKDSRDFNPSRSGAKPSRTNSKRKITPSKHNFSRHTTPRNKRNPLYQVNTGIEGSKKLTKIRKTRAQILREKKLEEKIKKMKNSEKKREKIEREEKKDRREWVGIGKREERITIGESDPLKNKGKNIRSKSKRKDTKKKQDDNHNNFVKKSPVFQNKKISLKETKYTQKEKIPSCEIKEEIFHKNFDLIEYKAESAYSESSKTTDQPTKSKDLDESNITDEECAIKTHDYYFNLIPTTQKIEQNIEDQEPMISEIPLKQTSYPILPVIPQRSIEEDEEDEEYNGINLANSGHLNSESYFISYREDDSSDYGLDESSLQKIAESNICMAPADSTQRTTNRGDFTGRELSMNIEEERINVIRMLDKVVKSTGRTTNKNLETAEAILSFYTDQQSRSKEYSPLYGQFRNKKEKLGNQIETSNSSSQDMIDRQNLPTSSFRDRIMQNRGIYFNLNSNMEFNNQNYLDGAETSERNIKKEQREKSTSDLLTHSEFLSFRGTPSPIQEKNEHNSAGRNSSDASLFLLCNQEQKVVFESQEEPIGEFSLERKTKVESIQINVNENNHKENIPNSDSFRFSCSAISNKSNKEVESQPRNLSKKSSKNEVKAPQSIEEKIEDKENRIPLSTLKDCFNTKSSKENQRNIPNGEKLQLTHRSLTQNENYDSDTENISQIKKYLSLKHQDFSENEIAISLKLFNSIPAE